MTHSEQRGYKYFDLIMALFVAVLLISNIASTKILKMGPFTFDGGTLLFPISYIFGDILTEVYGYQRSRRVIWVGFGCAALMAVVLTVVGALPPAEGWEFQDAYEAILGTTPRIVLASLIAYFAGEFSNSYTLARMKVLTQGRWLWTQDYRQHAGGPRRGYCSLCDHRFCRDAALVSVLEHHHLQLYLQVRPGGGHDAHHLPGH